MIVAILDTNVILQSVIGSPRNASRRVLRAYDRDRFRLAFSRDTIDEALNALTIPRIRSRHGWNDDQILRFVVSLLTNAVVHPGRQRVSGALARDVSDTKFLALAEEAAADYLVTNDRRHLGRLKRFGKTRIVSPARFLRLLG